MRLRLPHSMKLKLLEDWLLRVGRSSDFNTAMLSSAQIIAGTCVGIAGVRGMEEVGYDLCIVDEASKATATRRSEDAERRKRGREEREARRGRAWRGLSEPSWSLIQTPSSSAPDHGPTLIDP